jgi:metal-sulfur cluster biosynthetic enzyme
MKEKRDVLLLSEEMIRERLRDVVDPELRLSVVDLGLIYAVEIDGPKVRITYTLTSPACPLGGLIAEQIREAVVEMPGVRAVELNLTFSPPWDPRTMASEDARMELGIW